MLKAKFGYGATTKKVRWDLVTCIATRLKKKRNFEEWKPKLKLRD